MVVRALLAVLTLVGAVPLRVCTCGAAHAHHASAPAEHDHTDDCDPVEHDDGCGVHKPRPAMAEGVSAPTADVPADNATAALPFEPVALLATPAPVSTEPRSPDPPSTPLYISLCALRN